jgi:hypothetical protein
MGCSLKEIFSDVRFGGKISGSPTRTPMGESAAFPPFV